MDCADPLLAPMVDSMREFQRGFGHAASGGGVIELPGVVACLTPALGAHSLFNAAIFDSVDQLRAALPELERRYRDAGVTAWGVWAHSSDSEAERALTDRGMRLDSTPAAMARALDGDLRPADGAPVERTADLDAVDLVTALAWGFPVGTTIAAQPRLLEAFNLYLGRDERGDPGCVVGTVHHRGDCGVTLVGTAPAARGRGLARAVMLFALDAARRAGCRTTTLQATDAGRPIYQRLGYRELGTMNLWELRSS